LALHASAPPREANSAPDWPLVAIRHTSALAEAPEIFARFGPSGITEFELVGGVARISDDTQMTLFTAEGLLEGRKENVVNALDRIIELGAIPIVNENDTVAIDELELEMGENDSLAANVAVLAKADLLIIMSDIEGLFDKDPHKYDDAELIPVVQSITDEIRSLAGGAGSKLGTGGMATKIKAAEIARNGGIDLIIMNGRDPRRLYKIFENKPVGTLFTAK